MLTHNKFPGLLLLLLCWVAVCFAQTVSAESKTGHAPGGKSKEISVETDSDGIVFTAIVENISDITKLRTRRIALANERLPPRLKLLMIFMSIVLIASFMLLGVQNIYTHVGILVSLSIAIHLLYMVIEDLDHPFYGIWNIPRRPLEELVNRFAKGN